MNREQLIQLAVECNGDYDIILKMIKSNDVPEVYEDLPRNVITIFDEDYPKSFLELEKPPFVIFYKGNKALLKENNIKAIVGSRKPTDYAINATKTIIQKEPNRIIVSGLALGIDAVAHETANKSIGVLGCGIDFIYPQQNRDLFKKVEETGLIISEYPGTTKPLGYHFPFRNRLVAALADEVNVMELTEKSGTMITVNEALELGKSIKVLPFDYNLENEKGLYNNVLINEGASVIL